MDWTNTTKFILAATVILLALYDIAAIHFGGPDASISRVALAWAREYPILAITLGVVIGHIFWAN